VVIERSVPAIGAVLGELAPEAGERFRAAFQAPDDGIDPAAVDEVLDRWWGVATILANPLSE
jgi:hypothetical protein